MNDAEAAHSPDVTLLRPDGSSARLTDYPAPLLVIFLRHLACIACRAHLRAVQEHYEAIKQCGGEVLAVSFSPPGRVRVYLDKHPLPFPAVSDPDLSAYRAFGIGRATWGKVLHPVTLARYMKTMVQGVLPERPAGEDDLLQLGGDFILDRERRLVFAHPSGDPFDRPTPAELLAVLQKLPGQAGESH